MPAPRFHLRSQRRQQRQQLNALWIRLLLGICLVAVAVYGWAFLQTPDYMSKPTFDRLRNFRKPKPKLDFNTTVDDLTSEPNVLSILSLGDYGTGLPAQFHVAATLGEFARAIQPKPAFILSPGDQIYDHGLTSATDPQVNQKFNKVYKSPGLDIPWYMTIGNHDCEGSIDAMLEYAKTSTRWKFPSRYYTFDHRVDAKTIVRVFVLDECDLVCGHEPRNFRCVPTMNAQTSAETRSQQYLWLEKELARSAPRTATRMWKIVMGHWGVYSFAGNGNTAELIQHLEPLLQKHKVHIYLSGHDHCMQHIRLTQRQTSAKWRPHYLVNGAGGYRVHDLNWNSKANPELRHVEMVNGFMWLRLVSGKFIRVQFVNAEGSIVYTTEIEYLVG